MPPKADLAALAAEPFSSFDVDALSGGDCYKLLSALVTPRPIAWIVSKSGDGELNAAPYSFFNMLSSDPPLVATAFSQPPDRTEKDSLHNILERREYVINLVGEETAEAMNVTAVNAPRGTDETGLAGLKLVPCAVVDVPRIAASPAALECRVWQVIPTGKATTIVLGEVVYAHVRTSAFEDLERLHVDPAAMKLIGRMHGGSAGGYCTTRELFNLDRPSWPLK